MHEGDEWPGHNHFYRGEADLFLLACTIQGEFFSISNHQEAPFTPNPLPAVNDTGKMMYVWLTEYMADTAGFVYQQAGQLNYNVTPSVVSTVTSSKCGIIVIT